MIASHILFAVFAMSTIGVFAGVGLYYIAQSFKVEEDPRIDQIASELPGANCGGCGQSGCRAFAEAVIKQGSIEGLFCPVGGNPCMEKVAGIMGIAPVEKEPMVAVLRCNGSFAKRQKTSIYDSARSCLIASIASSGDTGCAYGCYGFGDCVVACHFDAIFIVPHTGLPDISEEKCIGCGACVKACPKSIIELRKRGPEGKRVFVSCVNMDKGAVARKNCLTACIGCGKCVKTCSSDAIRLERNCAYIDFNKCTLCGACVAVCPTKAIHAVHFPAETNASAQPTI